MRKALLVLALVGAAFAGGAVVNGPGLALAKAWLGAQLGMKPVGEPGAPGEETVAVDAGLTPEDLAPGGPLPAKPVPPLTGPKAGPDPAGAAPVDAPKPAAVAAAEPALPKLEPAPVESDGPPLTPPADAAVAAEKPPAAPPPTVAAPPAPAAVVEVPGDPPTRPKGAGWGDAPGSAPAQAVVPGREPNPVAADRAVAAAAVPGAAAPPTTGAPSTWADLRRRMAAAGISRYWIESEPNGPARVRCLIPLAGRHAVSQQFEGEGDDEIQAAESALKRVALWRASEAR